MRKVLTWLQQLFCPHLSREWRTWPDPKGGIVATVIEGGCVRCGKSLPPPCEKCGR